MTNKFHNRYLIAGAIIFLLLMAGGICCWAEITTAGGDSGNSVKCLYHQFANASSDRGDFTIGIIVHPDSEINMQATHGEYGNNVVCTTRRFA